MENKIDNNSKAKNNSTRLVLLFALSLFLVVALTFSFTLSYFGGRSSGISQSIIMKSSVEFDSNGGKVKCVNNLNGTYMIPGTSVYPVYNFTITNTATQAQTQKVNGLIRVDFSVNSTINNLLGFTANYFDAYLGSAEADMIDDNKIGRLVKASDNNWYLVSDTTATTIANNTALYEVNTQSGPVSLVFKIGMSIGEFDNGLNATATITTNITVIQSEFYNTSTGTLLDKNYQNAKPIFDSVTA